MVSQQSTMLKVHLLFFAVLIHNCSSFFTFVNYVHKHPIPKCIYSTRLEESRISPDEGRTEKKNKNGGHHISKKLKTVSASIETWRIFGVEVNPDSLGSDIALDARKQYRGKDGSSSGFIPSERSYFTKPVVDALCSRLKAGSKDKKHKKNGSKGERSFNANWIDARVVRRSLDARKNRGRGKPSHPCYTYVIDIDLSKSSVKKLRLKHQPGRCELISIDGVNSTTENDDINYEINQNKKKRVIIVGAGPAGLFCALTLAQQSNQDIIPILLERGQPVERRGRSIGALVNRVQMDSESNFAFGEGGAGTWSDGKLTTRIGRNSNSVRFVLKTLVKYGAPEKILVDGSPHLGTENLVRLLRNMRKDLIDLGGDIRFGAKVTNILKKGGAVEGVEVEYTTEKNSHHQITNTVKEIIYADAVVLATGHSARDVYEQLAQMGVILQPKGFATGFRVEHPQTLINKIQYGNDWSPSVVTGKKPTDDANFPLHEKAPHNGRLPVASYRLATDKAFDGTSNRGAYSFCMCPGGQIIPASTDPNEVCVNGMSFSKRDSLFANSALVVTVAPDDPLLEPYREQHGVLAGVAFQRDMERRAAKMGGGNLVVPVQSLQDFVNKRISSSSISPPSSYRLGVKAGVPCHEIYPDSIVHSLADALQNQFERSMPGFLSSGQGILHSVETRTSSPVTICRSDTTMEALGIKRLYPAGEGAGFAGGIVSAAVDGMVVAEAVMEDILGSSHHTTSKRGKKEKSLGFDY